MQRQPDLKPGSKPRLALQLKPAAVRLGQFPSDTESQPHPLGEAPSQAASHKRLEHLFLVIQRDPGPRIAHAHPDLTVLFARIDRDRAAGWGEFYGIADQITDHLPKSQGISLHYWYGFGQLQLPMQAFLKRGLLPRNKRFRQPFKQVSG